MKTKATAVRDTLMNELDYERALGRLAINFALLHFLLERYGWSFWGLHPEFSQILTKDLPIKHLAEKLLSSLREIELEKDVHDLLVKILKRVQKLAEQRNDLLHALWVFEDGKPVQCFRRRAKLQMRMHPPSETLKALAQPLLTQPMTL